MVGNCEQETSQLNHLLQCIYMLLLAILDFSNGELVIALGNSSLEDRHLNSL